ncbi:hypothetical protein F5Y15DRAFT_89659 [Xylariaceae sp. FL0016]|nr:hypothetical protein F5Y15DRAFT_89659 [Xylariaceae sp. FL0016]
MDPVSLTLAILPLVGGTCKAYGGLHRRLKGFCHYSREVRRARKQFDRQRHFFRNEVHLLVRAAFEDDATIESMLDNPSHDLWKSQELERSLKKHLEKNYDAFLEVIEDIGSLNEELAEFMECFHEIEQQRREGEAIKEAVRRLRDRTKVAWDKSEFEASITSLRNSNDDLKRLRQQVSELQKPSTREEGLRKHVPQEYGEYRLIHRAAKALHAALSTAWSTPAASCIGGIVRHEVMLFIDAKVKDGVQMDLTVACSGMPNLYLTQRPMTRLLVKSQVVDWIESGLQTPPPSDNGRQKRREVRFADDCTSSTGLDSGPRDTGTSPPESSGRSMAQPEDLSGVDFCSTLMKKTLRPNDQLPSPCIGYIDTQADETFRHSLFRTEKNHTHETQHVMSVYQAMACPAEDSLSIVDQLKLVRNLVTTVLKFHSTPWLGQYFTLNDLTICQSAPELSVCLQTLHLNAKFTKDCHVLNPTSMCDPESTDTSAAEVLENAKFQYGIRSLTLWSLGTVLLQIGQWAAVERPDDVMTVRKLSSQTPALGPRYQELTKRCLECDFGYGEDLSKPRLQQAVYENVVCELSDMISSLDLHG